MLKARYSAAIEIAVTRARASRDLRMVKASDGAGEGIAWGVNAAGSGVNVIRGIRRPDGADVIVR